MHYDLDVLLQQYQGLRGMSDHSEKQRHWLRMYLLYYYTTLHEKQMLIHIFVVIHIIKYTQFQHNVLTSKRQCKSDAVLFQGLIAS